MTRVKSGVQTKRRHKKVLKEASGYFGSKHRLYKSAKEQLMHSSVYAYRDRRQKKREFRKLWITRINAACRMNDISYSKFIDGLNKTGKVKEVKVTKTETKKEEKKETKEVVDLSSKTVAELKEIAKEKGIEGYTTMKKAELLEVLK